MTGEELRKRLKYLSDHWPEGEGYWIFAADGKLYLMQKNDRDERAYLTEPGGGVDPDYIVDSFPIPSDGGDW